MRYMMSKKAEPGKETPPLLSASNSVDEFLALFLALFDNPDYVFHVGAYRRSHVVRCFEKR